MLDWLKNIHRRGNPAPAEELEMSRQDHFLTDAGYEIPDPVPVAPPVGYKKQPSMVENIRNMVRSELLMQEAAAAGYESFEESENFGPEDDDDTALPVTAYEAVFDPPPAAPPSDGPPATPPAPSSDGSPQGGPAAPSGAAPGGSTPAAPASAPAGVQTPG